MRTFIAIELPDEIRSRLAELRDAGIVAGRGVRWVAPESLHLTLKFLGEVDERRVPELGAALCAAAQPVRSLDLSVRGVGCFPNLRAPRVFWAGLERSGALEQLVAAIEARFASLGFAPERRPFQSHITLARIDAARGRIEIDRARLDPEVPSFGAFGVRRVVLMESRLGPQGSRYTPAFEAPLL